MGIKRPVPQSVDWSSQIAKDRIKELLLGKDPKFFMPEDGKSVAAINHYRWYHNRTFVLKRVFEFYDRNVRYDELRKDLLAAIELIAREDCFVALDVIASAIGGMYYSTTDRSRINNKEIYRAIRAPLKETFKNLDLLPEKTVNVPEDFPGDFEKLKESIRNYFRELDVRYACE